MVILAFIIIVGKGFLVPITFGMVLALTLKPICDGVERYIPNRILAIFITMVLIILPVLGIFGLFSMQLLNVFDDFGLILQGVLAGIERTIQWANDTLSLGISNPDTWVSETLDTAVAEPLSIVTDGLSSSTVMIANTLLVFIYTFFFLLYRTGFKNFILGQVSPDLRSAVYEVLEDVEFVVQRYLYGLLLVIVILAVLNSLGLWLIGINYAFFWGFLAACLAVIPYIGTTLGGFLPFIYAFATNDSLVKPLLVVALYATVQSIEGNFITPKVVGGSVHINPLTAIVALIIGGLFWGIAGMVLALPLTAILKITLENIERTRPLSLLLSDELFERQEEFLHRYDKEKYRLLNIFRRVDEEDEEEVEEKHD